MAEVTFLVLDGVDKGRRFIGLVTPVTIGREEGNTIRLNDDRVSRYHAKIQEDQGQIVLTDLDSTNGTRVNGEAIQLRLLRAGDRVSVGRSTLVYGSAEEIDASLLEESSMTTTGFRKGDVQEGDDSAMGLGTDLGTSEKDFNFDSDSRDDVFRKSPPELPTRMSPAQAAQLSEVIDFLHRALAESIDPVHIPPKAREARLPLSSWHKIQTVLAFLADYSRRVSDPANPPKKEDDDATNLA